jgi:integrase
MARQLNRLRASDINRRGPGLHADGGGLYLNVTDSGARSWIFRYRIKGRLRDHGLGPTHTISLAMAREAALQRRRERHAGTDPIDSRRAKRQEEETKRKEEELSRRREISFQEVADQHIASHASGWRGSGSEEQWRQSLKDHVFPFIGDLPVAEIDTGLIVQVLNPIWRTKTETAKRVRNRIENILDYAKTSGFREGENPARWRGHLKNLLPDLKRVRQAKQHAALPFDDVPAFMIALRKDTSIPARALEFAILTASRIGEVLGASWEEVDLKQRVWTISSDRMKAGREHRVPLSDAALAVLERMSDIRSSEFIFPGARNGARLFPAAVRRVLARIEPGVTVHGMRATFSSWAAERTNYASEIREIALAHQIGSAVVRAYQRSDLFDRRRRLMADWAAFCDGGASGDVVPMQRRRARR